MQPLIRTYEVCRLRAQTEIGRSPFLYQLLHRLRGVPIRPLVESHRLAPTATALYRRLLGAAQ